MGKETEKGKNATVVKMEIEDDTRTPSKKDMLKVNEYIKATHAIEDVK